MILLNEILIPNNGDASPETWARAFCQATGFEDLQVAYNWFYWCLDGGDLERRVDEAFECGYQEGVEDTTSDSVCNCKCTSCDGCRNF